LCQLCCSDRKLCLLAYLTLTLGLTLGLGPNKNMGFTFLLPAGSTECFYQKTAMNDSMEVEYQVIAGSGLDVGFILLSPTGHRLVSDFRRSDGIHTWVSVQSEITCLSCSLPSTTTVMSRCFIL
uniref:Transmembrane p24 trafficking protein 1a n=1 Tax=Oreochromis niloticus TaxID=8128 RepID=A0A669CJQ1_ORENI